MEERFGGPVVYQCDKYLLRDDTKIREEAGIFERNEAYSLFQLVPEVKRVEVFAMSKEDAILNSKIRIKDLC